MPILRLPLFCLTIFAFFTSYSQTDQICKIWYNQEKDAKLEVYQTGKDFEAKIIWLREPTENGKPKTDKNNPDEKLKNRPVIGLVVLKKITKSETKPELYEGGTIYDPKNGKTYDCRMTFTGRTIELRGFVLGMPFLGRTSLWTLPD